MRLRRDGLMYSHLCWSTDKPKFRRMRRDEGEAGDGWVVHHEKLRSVSIKQNPL